MDASECLTRREQIGAKNEKKKKAGRPKKSEPKKAARGRGRGRGRGKGGGRASGGGGRGKVMKRPACKPPPAKKEDPEEDQEAGEEEEQENDPPVEEGACSAPSNGNPERGASKRFRRSKPMQEEEEDEQEEGQEAPLPKAKAKAAGKSKAKPKLRAERPPRPPPAFEWETELWDEIEKCLAECCNCGEHGTKGKHTHREASPMDDFVQYSVYWARSAVGVKVRRAVSDKWCQVAYFARDTPCVFTNLLIASQWASQACTLCKPDISTCCHCKLAVYLTICNCLSAKPAQAKRFRALRNPDPESAELFELKRALIESHTRCIAHNVEG